MSELADWIESHLGHRPPASALASYERALTHPSRGSDHYERLEFLGDRVLGLIVSEWLLEVFANEAEGKLAHRLNALVAGEVCAEVAREIGLPSQLRLGKQALDDGVYQSDNVLGDVIESLIGALYLDAGLDTARRFVRNRWSGRIDRLSAPPKHPKAQLQEWTAAQKRRPPEYEVVETSGPDHALRFKVKVAIKGKGEAVGEGGSKQEAEKEAAAAMLDQLK